MKEILQERRAWTFFHRQWSTISRKILYLSKIKNYISARNYILQRVLKSERIWSNFCTNLIFVVLHLNNVFFWVPWVTLWYPKIIVLKSMISKLSNAVSDTFFTFPSAFLQCYEVWSFFRIFRGKMHILECLEIE